MVRLTREEELRYNMGKDPVKFCDFQTEDRKTGSEKKKR
jgi:hypothetical protein